MSTCIPSPLEADLRPAIAHIRTFEPPIRTDRFKANSDTITAFGNLQSAFVPTGQTDTQLLKDVQRLLQVDQLAPIVPTLKAIVGGRVTAHADDAKAVGWMFLDLLDAIETEAVLAGLSPARRGWLLFSVYAALIAYGPEGAALPTRPEGLQIDVCVVPGPKPRQRWGDDRDEDDDPVEELVVRL